MWGAQPPEAALPQHHLGQGGDVPEESIPHGYCQCGCGQLAPIAPDTHRARGYVKGESRRFISGHNGAHRPFTPLEQRYRVEDRGYVTPCWIWLMSFNHKGYARMWSPQHGRVIQASRFFYEHFVGQIPGGFQLDHLCRVRLCVNPEHLEPVTQYVNQQRGSNAKLTREQADEIRLRRSRGESGMTLAKEFGVSHPVIYGIGHGTLWP